MESRPKVLMFIDWYLPGFRAGGPIRSCINMVEHLGEHVDFFIVTSDRDYQSKVAYPDIPILQWITLDRGEKVMYMPPDQLDRSMLKRLTDEQHFDHVYIHGLFSKRFSILTHRHFSSTAIPVIIAPRGMLRRSAVSLKGTKKKLFLKAARWSGQYGNTTFHATDTMEVKDIKKYFGDEVRIILAPNLPQKSKAPVQSISKRPGTLKLLFAGRIAPEKNLAFAIERLLDLERGDVELDILGAVYDESYHQECLRLIDRLEGSIRVRILDPVAHDELKKVIKQHHVLFLPTRGENFGHIILESFMMGRPVLISDQTPWRNLESQGVGFDLALKDEQAWTKRLDFFLQMDQTHFDAMCRAAHEKYQEFCNDPEIVKASKGLFLSSE